MTIRVLLCLALLFVAPHVWSHRAIDPGSEKIFSASDVVVIGWVVYYRQDGYKNEVSLFPVSILKGEISDLYRIEFSSRVAELRPDCCTQGGTYIFYLKKWPDGVLRPMSGKFGIILVDDPDTLSGSRFDQLESGSYSETVPERSALWR